MNADARALLVPDFPMETILDALRQDGYAAIVDGIVLIVPARWRVFSYGANWKLEYWVSMPYSMGYWEHYTVMPTLIDSVRLAVQL